jgi:cytidine deaminase
VVAWVPTEVVPEHPGNYTVYRAMEVEHLGRFASIVERIGLNFRAAVEPSEEDS